MADIKITNLTVATSAASNDLVAMVDVDDTTMASSGTTKQITKANLTSDLASSSHTHTLVDVTDVTASAAEVNLLDGVTASTTEINMLDALDTDLTSVSASDDTLASAKAVKTYVDAQVDTADTLAELTDTTLSAPADSEFLVHTGSAWVNEGGATARASLGVDVTGTDNSTDVTVAGTPDYITIDAATQVITRGQVDLAADVTGTLPAAKGGTGLTAITTLVNSNTTASDVGLGNVDNTSDANKPVSTAQQTESDTKQDIVTAGTGLSFTGVTLNAEVTQSELDGKAAAGANSDITSLSGLTTDLSIAHGGTGASTATAAFDALSPLTTQGDILFGGTSGTGTRLAKGSTAGHVLTMNSGATAPEWAAGGIASVAADTTPQLGGFLDPDSNYIGMAKGTDIVSASPLVLTGATAGKDGDYFDVTGTTGFAAMTVDANRHFFLQFDGALTLTHHATNLDLPGEASITTAAGDVAEFFSTGTNTVQCVNYTKADGTAVVGGSGSGTVTSIAVTGSDGIQVDSGSPITSSGTIALGLTAIDSTKIANGTVTDAEFQYIGGLTSDAQTQIDGKSASGHSHSYAAQGANSDITSLTGLTTDLSVAQGGTGASTLNDLITLTTHTTGNYVATVTGGTGIASTGATTGEGIGHSLSLDIDGLADITNTTFGNDNFGAGDMLAVYDTSATAEKKVKFPVELGFAVSDETSVLATGTGKLTFRMPHAMTLTEIRGNVNTAPTGADIVVDVNDGGSSVFSIGNELTIDQSAKTSTTSASSIVLGDTALADDAEITVDIDTVGSTVEGKGLKIWLIGYR